MNWIELKDEASVNSLYQQSLSFSDKVFVIFKHSTRCATSRMARNLFESEWNIAEPVYLVNVIESRIASNTISRLFKVSHESPQVLAIRNGNCILDNSHAAIDAGEIIPLVSSKPSR